MVRRVRKPAQDGAEGAIRTAVTLLAYKENTKRELFDKLLERGYGKEDAEAAVAFVVAKRYLDEERYYFRFVENCANARLYGKKRILQEQRLKKFSIETIEKCAQDAFASIDFNENCYRALCRLPRADMRKTAAALMRRGFAASEIRAAAVRKQKEEQEEFDEEDGSAPA